MFSTRNLVTDSRRIAKIGVWSDIKSTVHDTL